MQRSVFSHCLCACIRVAIPAQMGAGVILADVTGQKAAALAARRLVARGIELFSQRCFIDFHCHAAGAVDPKLLQFLSLGAGFKPHAMFPCNTRHFPSQEQTLLCRHLTRLRKIAAHLLVQVDKADDTNSRAAFQESGHIFKCGQMPLNSIRFR